MALKSHPSPYIRSHADDPINWKLVDSKTITEAKQNNRPIIISSGYQSCYWCYRMKIDTFSNKKLASKINQLFLPLLIDREIEPLLDKQLQAFMEEQRGFGGWPLTVILTPQGHPIAGFSYINAESLKKAIEQFLRQWNKNPVRVTELAQASAIARYKAQQQQDQLIKKTNYQSLLQQFLHQVSSVSDDQFGGFGDKEKFPNYPQLNALLDLYSLNPDKPLGEFIQLTLNNMLDGAIRDQLSGGFFRYVENREWKIPHYEQMLYTQALMGKLLIRAGQTFKNPNYIVAGRDTLLNMVNRFFDKKNSLYNSSLSAIGGQNKAGGYYLWKQNQLEKYLGKNGHQSIQNLLSNKELLVLPKPLGKNAKKIRITLLKERDKRTQDIDDKKLIAWQGLVLSALAYGSQLSPELNKAARHLAGKVQRLTTQIINQNETEKLTEDSNQTISTNGLADSVYVAQGLLDWWQITGEEKVLETAQKLLVKTYQQHYKEGRWLQGNTHGFLEAPSTLALVDTQLPSPSAIWLSLSWALSALDKNDKNSQLTQMANQVGSRLPQALQSNAFFHASLISTLIAREWRLRNNLADSKKVN